MLEGVGEVVEVEEGLSPPIHTNPLLLFPTAAATYPPAMDPVGEGERVAEPPEDVKVPQPPPPPAAAAAPPTEALGERVVAPDDPVGSMGVAVEFPQGGLGVGVAVESPGGVDGDALALAPPPPPSRGCGEGEGDTEGEGRTVALAAPEGE